MHYSDLLTRMEQAVWCQENQRPRVDCLRGFGLYKPQHQVGPWLHLTPLISRIWGQGSLGTRFVMLPLVYSPFSWSPAAVNNSRWAKPHRPRLLLVRHNLRMSLVLRWDQFHKSEFLSKLEARLCHCPQVNSDQICVNVLKRLRVTLVPPIFWRAAVRSWLRSVPYF